MLFEQSVYVKRTSQSGSVSKYSSRVWSSSSQSCSQQPDARTGVAPLWFSRLPAVEEILHPGQNSVNADHMLSYVNMSVAHDECIEILVRCVSYLLE
ncbi:hypothetical protein AAHA92_21235 [Salvia divinorum]|uniref:Uncharacterized protein n=1 Tax=Salvia divinorum TaxID=28513 RepID=A0ABD1GKZ8_SALDI